MKKVQSKTAKSISLLMMFLATFITLTNAQGTEKKPEPQKKMNNTEQELIDLSKQKWQWMSEKKVDRWTHFSTKEPSLSIWVQR